MASGDPLNTDAKPKPKKAVKLSQKEQSERFKETARELESDETGDSFKRVFEKIVPQRARRDLPKKIS